MHQDWENFILPGNFRSYTIVFSMEWIVSIRIEEGVMEKEPVVQTEKTPNRQNIYRRRSRLATIGALLVVLLIVGISALAYALIAPHRQGQGAPPATSGAWEKALTGYLVTSLVAAPGNPTVLYACAQRNQGSGVVSSLNMTVLRSADGGLHWQDVGGNAGAIMGCQIAVNPSNSNEVYLVTTMNNGNGQQPIAVLKHTTDGGQTWNAIQPALSITGVPQVWNISQLSMVGQHLFGVQMLAAKVPTEGRKGTAQPYVVYNLPRLVTSSDGGHTWSVLDQQFTAAHQGVSSYAVDPASITTVYDLVSVPWLPILPITTGLKGNFPAFTSTAELYKTTDDGATWQPVLTNLPFGSTVQLAANQPQIVYAGGIRRPMPLVGAMPGASSAAAIGNFQLHVSSDGGANWRDAPALPASMYPQSWLANDNGQAYIYAGSLYARPTGGVGTAISATAVTIPRVTPQSGQPGMPMIRQPALTPPPTVTATPAQIERYDPTTNQWSAVTKPPAAGNLLAVTPGSGNSDLLWFMGSSSNQPILYRATVG